MTWTTLATLALGALFALSGQVLTGWLTEHRRRAQWLTERRIDVYDDLATRLLAWLDVLGAEVYAPDELTPGADTVLGTDPRLNDLWAVVRRGGLVSSSRVSASASAALKSLQTLQAETHCPNESESYRAAVECVDDFLARASADVGVKVTTGGGTPKPR